MLSDANSALPQLKRDDRAPKLALVQRQVLSTGLLADIRIHAEFAPMLVPMVARSQDAIASIASDLLIRS